MFRPKQAHLAVDAASQCRSSVSAFLLFVVTLLQSKLSQLFLLSSTAEGGLERLQLKDGPNCESVVSSPANPGEEAASYRGGTYKSDDGYFSLQARGPQRRLKGPEGCHFLLSVWESLARGHCRATTSW